MLRLEVAKMDDLKYTGSTIQSDGHRNIGKLKVSETCYDTASWTKRWDDSDKDEDVEILTGSEQNRTV